MIRRNLRLPCRRQSGRNRERGQMLALFAVFLVVLILFMGLGIDLGFVYITKAQLSKAVDAAALAGMSNFYQGSATASNIAAGTFAANFMPSGNKPGYIQTKPVPSINFSVDAASNQTLTVSATATINTFFVGVLPWWKTMNVADTGKATRAKVIMTLVLDRSGSMDPVSQASGGCGTTLGGQWLPSAVANFISVFEDTVDQAAMVSFASTSVTNVAMGTPFVSAITTAASGLIWSGGTFAHGGLSNALAINNSVVVPTNVNAIKVVVFFTDGQCNMIQNTLTCPTGASQSWNFGGYLNSGDPVAFWLPNDPYTHSGQLCAQYLNTGGGYGCGGDSCSIPAGCGGLSFPSVNGGTLPITVPNIVSESQARCVQVANQMRANGMYVYSIGLAASAASADIPSYVFLQEVANDRASPTYDRTLPTGEAVITGNGAELNQLFQQIAGDILTRLTY